MHASDHAANAAIISGPLREIYQRHQQHPTTGLMVLGDFNFVPDTTLDRRHRVDAAQQQNSNSSRTHNHRSNNNSSSSILCRGTLYQPQHGRSIFRACVMPGATGTLRAWLLHMSEQMQRHVLIEYTARPL
jgi:hypothetical protein